MKTNNCCCLLPLPRCYCNVAAVARCNFCPGLRLLFFSFFSGQLRRQRRRQSEQAMHIKTSSVPHKCQHVSKLLLTSLPQSTHHNNNKSPARQHNKTSTSTSSSSTTSREQTFWKPKRLRWILPIDSQHRTEMGFK